MYRHITLVHTYASMRKYAAIHVLHHTDVQTIHKNTRSVRHAHIHHANMIQNQLNSLDARVFTVASFCQYVSLDSLKIENMKSTKGQRYRIIRVKVRATVQYLSLQTLKNK